MLARRAADLGLRGDALMSEHPGHLTELAAEAVRAGATQLVVVGGDGTVYEVVNGLLDVNKVSSLPLLRILCAMVTKRLRELDDKIVGWYILSGGGATSSI